MKAREASTNINRYITYRVRMGLRIWLRDHNGITHVNMSTEDLMYAVKQTAGRYSETIVEDLRKEAIESYIETMEGNQ